MKPILSLFALTALLLSSCTTTRLIPSYHVFTNEFDVVGQVENDQIEVYHQIIGEDLSIKMVNLSDTHYLFNWAKSTVALNNQIVTNGDNPEIALIPAGKMYETTFPLVYTLENQGLDLSNPNNSIKIKTYLVFSDINGHKYAMNTYTLKKLYTAQVPPREQGANYIQLNRTEQVKSGAGAFTTVSILFLLLIALST